MKRIRDILMRHKTPVSVQDDVTYKQVTIRTNYKGVVLRGTKVGATIGTKNQWRVSADQFILSRIDARNGAFGIIPAELEGAIVTNDFLAFDINEDEVEREFFNVFLQSPVFLDACIKASKGNTNRKRVDEDFFLNFEVNLPPLPEQHDLIKKINKARSSVGIVQREIKHQQALLDKLKQAILQEAIQGKLTADWRAVNPDVEPARELLQRIQAEKARLIAEKKTRKEKPLPAITPEEIPFEIPDGWGWCRFGSFVGEYKAGKSFKCQERSVVGSEWGVLKTSAVTSSYFLEEENKFYSDERPPDCSAQVWEGDLIFCRASGSKGLAGTAAIIDSFESNLLLSDKTIRVTLLCGVSKEYIWFHNNSVATAGYYRYLNSGKSTSMNNITKDQLLSKPIPLPPLTEQAAIVERVEALMCVCHQLEVEIESSCIHASDLLRAVLKEAFTSAS